MLNNNYELNIISRDSRSDGKKLKKYSIDSTDYVGIYDHESFEIQFKNNTWSRIQVKISIDGTDVLTGAEADLSPSGKMWVVEPYGTLQLKAWPETTKGGAEFIFSDVKSSVAANTHGDLSSRGVIAAAVFVEDLNVALNYNRNRRTIVSKPSWSVGGGLLYGSTYMPASNGIGSVVGNCLDSEPAVGAGEFVSQQIGSTYGLTKPVFNTALIVRYEWWTELRSKLRALGVPTKQNKIDGFPGEQKLINLGKTPRKTRKQKKQHVELHRFI